MTPRQANRITDLSSIQKLIDRINKKKTKNKVKINKSKEHYVENRTKGYIKNYKRVRHKDQPYYRKFPLKNVHLVNIKRKPKFADTNDTNDDDNLSTRVIAGS